MDNPIRIACFGDSLTEGYGLAYDEALPTVLEKHLRDEGIETTCLNYGISGDTTDDGLRRIQQVVDAKPDCVILEFGANDFFVGIAIDEVYENFRALIETLKAQQLPILLVGITALEELDPEYKQQFDPLFSEMAVQYELPLFPDILASYYNNPSLKLMDDTHPNAQGVEAVARDLLPYVLDLLKQVKR